MSDPERGASDSGDGRLVSTAGAAEICRDLYLAPRDVSRLPGYDNDNFLVEDAAGGRFVLKVGSSASDRAHIELEVDVLRYLEEIDWPGVPRSLRSRLGARIERREIGERVFDVRLLTWLEGRPLAEVGAAEPRLLGETGRYLAGLDLALADYATARGIARKLPPARWNLAQPDTWPDTTNVEPAGDRRRVETALADLTRQLEAARPPWRTGLIHADANDHNVLIGAEAEAPRVVGLIDFGDCGESTLVFEIAIAATYVALEAADPWAAVVPLVAGYCEVLPLEGRELALLLSAVRARLALSLVMSASRRRQGTADPYVLVSERPARSALARLMELSGEEALERLASAVGSGAG